jgi:MinD-like ATPase involved in chromosome partitioning or flagellar assembly
VAVGVAAELAARGHDTLLVDADAFGGAVAQHLGVLDEVSGLLSAVRLANTGRLDVPRLAAAARTVAPHLRVLTGLPRADRWVEVRSAAFDALLEACRGVGDYVVLDLGFDLEGDGPGQGSDAPQRNQMTLAGLDSADDLLVVGAADPVGLSRLARGLVELRDRVPWASTHVVVNRMRPTVGWGQHEVRAMVEQLVSASSTRFLPGDQAAADRALALGCPLTELGESPLRSGLAGVVDALVGEPTAGGAPRRRVRLRRAGRAR